MGRNASNRTRRLLARSVVILTVVVVLLLFRLYDEVGQDQAPEDRFRVVRVIDGDTFELAGGDIVRLLAVDTPERDEPFHDDAAALLARRVLNQQVTLEYGARRRDQYGRLLSLARRGDELVNRTLIDSGMACVYLFRDSELSSQTIQSLIESQRGALDRGVGIWSLAHEPEPEYLRSPSSFRFHRPGCVYLRNSKSERLDHFRTREQALELGLSPCRQCKP